MVDTALLPARTAPARDISRTLIMWCPDWPAVAALAEAGLSAHSPAVIVAAGRVIVTTAAARAAGVRIGMRQRDAQSRCPELAVLPADPDRDARAFEPIAAVVETLIPAVEVLRPGLVACRISGLARYEASEDIAVERVIDLVEAEGVECRVGIAGSLPVAVLAARRSVIVPAVSDFIYDGPATGTSRVTPDSAFCAGLPLSELVADPAIAPPSWRDLADLLTRLGIRTAGELAALPERSVITRFGADGAALHELASGRVSRAVNRRVIAGDIAVERTCDPPLERVDTAAFLARAIAEEFHISLAGAGLACTRLAITATTGGGRQLHRVWRVTRPLSAADTADRLRWQLDGWLTRRPVGADDDIVDPRLAGITSLRLDALEAIDAGRIQYGLWGSDGSARAVAALARVQGLLGPDGVIAATRSGGRGVTDRVATAPFGEQILGVRDPAAPWPGALPTPAPTRAAILPGQTRPGTYAVGSIVQLTDRDGREVHLTDRGVLATAPARLGERQVTGWAGPWILDEQWWSGQLSRRARMQITTQVGPPMLLELIDRGWRVEAVYD